MAPCRVVPADKEMTHLARRPSPHAQSRARPSHERDCYIVAVTLIVAAGVMGHRPPPDRAQAAQWGGGSTLAQDVVVEPGRLPEEGGQEQQGTGDELECDRHGGESPSGVMPGALPDGQTMPSVTAPRLSSL